MGNKQQTYNFTTSSAKSVTMARHDSKNLQAHIRKNQQKSTESVSMSDSAAKWTSFRGATAGKAAKDCCLPRLWVSIGSYEKQPVEKKLWYNIRPCLAQIYRGGPELTLETIR